MYSQLTKATQFKYMTAVAAYLAPCRQPSRIPIPGLSPAVTFPILNTPICLHSLACAPNKHLPVFRSILHRSQNFLSILCSKDDVTSPSSIELPCSSAQTYLAARPPLSRAWTSHTDLLQCSEPDGGSLRIAVLLSGGVDSSVALRLLLAAGHQCTGYYLKIWFQEDFRNFWDECPWEEDLRYAQGVCDQVGVELRMVHLTEEYWARVVRHCVAEIRAGRTPNPDILCNSRVKFGAFYDKIDFSEFDRVASGHYARVDRVQQPPGSPSRVLANLRMSPDPVKDQTYFLSHLSQTQLRKLVFPLGGMPKSRVRHVAELLRLPNEKRKDSQGICFLGKLKFSEFVAQHLGEWRGRILEADSGRLLGMHNGFWFHTIGQRQGLGLSGGPWYVVAKNSATNTVFASPAPRYHAPTTTRRRFRANGFQWTQGTPLAAAQGGAENLFCKVRHGPKLYRCMVEFSRAATSGQGEQESDTLPSLHLPSPQSRADGMEGVGGWADVLLEEDDPGLAPGQYVALYDGDRCLGSGVMVEGSHDQGVSAQAWAESWKDWVEEGPKVGKKKRRREERRALESAALEGRGPPHEGVQRLATDIQVPMLCAKNSETMGPNKP